MSNDSLRQPRLAGLSTRDTALPARFPAALPALGAASLIAGATEAYGQIVYTPVNGGTGTVLNESGSLSLNFDGASLDEGTLSYNANEGSGVIQFGSEGTSLVAAAGSEGGTVILRIPDGSLINASDFTSTQNSLLGDDVGTGFAGTGTVRGFVGVRFNLNGGPNTFFGWVDLQLNRSGATLIDSVTVFGYAYQSTADAGINAGAIPEPGSAAAIVGGAAAVLALRRRKKSAPAAA